MANEAAFKSKIKELEQRLEAGVGIADAPSPAKVDASSQVDAPSPAKVDAPSPAKDNAPSPAKDNAPSPLASTGFYLMCLVLLAVTVGCVFLAFILLTGQTLPFLDLDWLKEWIGKSAEEAPSPAEQSMLDFIWGWVRLLLSPLEMARWCLRKIFWTLFSVALSWVTAQCSRNFMVASNVLLIGIALVFLDTMQMVSAYLPLLVFGMLFLVCGGTVVNIVHEANKDAGTSEEESEEDEASQ